MYWLRIFAPGAIGRLGLDYETVKAINPKLVMCSISAFGQQGPLKSKPGYDFIGAAYAGFLDMNGDPNGSPCFPGMAIGDASTGVHAVAAIACALLYRERTGKGQYLDISLVDSYFHYHETSVQAYSKRRCGIGPDVSVRTIHCTPRSECSRASRITWSSWRRPIINLLLYAERWASLNSPVIRASPRTLSVLRIAPR
jgi:hypothetical protein